ncbi:hypothetical protein P691DRAFT_712054 [Macrolepiota fuliginosa MF-IS2]|uniref:Uncharacterized protein n=1 Tax=Macrolepiota fuliginosa MF-IS2 TaxID=1400762 RepID=A0A9P6BXR4_9AGAR|nr:hypothetical protein P691DRAFT_712054 [Macrolepiota fuliginosa MF-IS2]
MPRELYSGTERKLLLAFDVGTTYSGISYSILDPGKEPEIQGVHKFPGQEMAGGNAKIPSVMYYGKDGRVRAAGAEAERDGVEIIAEEEEWIKVEWFKLHLRPKTNDFAMAGNRISPLPLGKTIVEVLSDFLTYLNDCAKQYIQEQHPGIGSSIWTGQEIHYVLSHPNGWEGPQQTLMRQAAEKAGLVSSRGRNKLTFITEGEASLNRCIEKGLMSESIRRGEGVTIVDAGGGTLDISAYACKPDGKSFEEIAGSQCHFKGSIFVSEAAEDFLDEYLRGSKFHRDISEMKRYFDKATKCSFRDPEDPHFIRFGSARDKDATLKIVGGKLRLDGKDVASFFEPSIQCIIDGVLTQRRTSHKPISNVFLVGGFAANDYLFKRVKDGLEPHSLRIFRPDTQINKVVADGAISGVLDSPVRSRVTRYDFGIQCFVVYNASIVEHAQRRWNCIECYTGEMSIPDCFSVILRRNTQVSETQEFRCTYFRGDSKKNLLRNMEMEILCYRGNLSPDRFKWMDNDPGNFHKVCTVKANLANIPIPRIFGPHGTYHEVTVDIVLLFGATELKAQIAWVAPNGVEKRGDAEIIYDTDI